MLVFSRYNSENIYHYTCGSYHASICKLLLNKKIDKCDGNVISFVKSLLFWTLFCQKKYVWYG